MSLVLLLAASVVHIGWQYLLHESGFIVRNKCCAHLLAISTS